MSSKSSGWHGRSLRITSTPSSNAATTALPGQPDGLIYLTDGSYAPLEVVSDNDVPHRRLSDALERQGETVAIASGAPGWYVALHHGSNLKRIRQRVPEILQELPPSEFVDGAVSADTWAAGHVDPRGRPAQL
ncbi:hypothetical protein EDF24_3724 [Curtobacterium sp. PhB130]|uniref:hypothetical protein n=1 Tax=Curtobacterium sp. PhB130 TaxID=2485178 RepID=UPI000FA27E81|nr:hypothetical protein [Curtobacterium sp. PhB130]ROS71866.1 hypothetical protein EDF24_3724 [Curtobacterium sp. PhB130]